MTNRHFKIMEDDTPFSAAPPHGALGRGSNSYLLRYPEYPYRYISVGGVGLI